MTNEKLLAAVLGVTTGMGITTAAHAQVNYGAAGSTYTQLFDTLPSVPNAPPNTLGTWADNSTLPGWYAAAGNTFGFRVDDGRSNTGGTYSFGATSPDPNPGERALGSISSGTTSTNFYGVRLVNTTGTTLDKFTLTYTGEQWRETTAIQNFLSFGYSTTTTAIQSGTYTSVAALDFGAVRYGGVGGATGDVKTDGNSAAYQAARSATVRIFNGGWAPGAELWLRFADGDSTGSDQGLAIDNFNFSAATAPTATNNSTLSVGGSKAPAAVHVGRVVRSFSSATTAVDVGSAGLDNTTYFADSPDGAIATPRDGTITAGGNVTLNVSVGASVTGPTLAGTDVTSNVYVQNTGNSADADVIVPVTAHVVSDRFVNTTESTAGLDFGKMLVGSTKSLTGTLTTTNTVGPTLAAKDANHLVVVKLPGATTATGSVQGDAYANVTMSTGTDQVFSDGTETTQRMITVTPTRSGEVVPGGGGGVRFPSFLNYDLQLGDTETAVGANLAGRIYVRGDFYRSAELSGDTGPVLAGSNATITNAKAPSGTAGDGNVGKRAAARMTSVAFNQSGWTAPSFGAGTIVAGTSSAGTAVPSTVSSAINLSSANKVNGQYDANLLVGVEHDDQTIHGTSANDLGTITIPVRGTVSDTVGTHTGTYALDGGSLTAGDTDLSGTFTQTGGTSSFGNFGGTGAITVGAGATLTANHVRAASLTVNGTATIRPNGGAAGTTIVNSLAVAGKLDLADNDLIVNHDGSVTEESIRQLVRNGRAAGSTSGIFSTPGATTDDVVLAIADNGEWGKTVFNGFDIDSTTIVGKYTYFGDSNLDGAVTGDDYLAIDAGLGTGNSWIEGDFNMSTTVTGDDYLAIDANLGKGTANPLAFAEMKAEMVAAHVAMFGEDYLVKLAEVEANGFTTVPEPAALSLIGLGAMGLLGRRRRRA